MCTREHVTCKLGGNMLHVYKLQFSEIDVEIKSLLKVLTGEAQLPQTSDIPLIITITN